MTTEVGSAPYGLAQNGVTVETTIVATFDGRHSKEK
jgi:hypothetical protein